MTGRLLRWGFDAVAPLLVYIHRCTHPIHINLHLLLRICSSHPCSNKHKHNALWWPVGCCRPMDYSYQTRTLPRLFVISSSATAGSTAARTYGHKAAGERSWLPSGARRREGAEGGGWKPRCLVHPTSERDETLTLRLSNLTISTYPSELNVYYVFFKRIMCMPNPLSVLGTYKKKKYPILWLHMVYYLNRCSDSSQTHISTYFT